MKLNSLPHFFKALFNYEEKRKNLSKIKNKPHSGHRILKIDQENCEQNYPALPAKPKFL